jgi:hypothetical protein
LCHPLSILHIFCIDPSSLALRCACPVYSLSSTILDHLDHTMYTTMAHCEFTVFWCGYYCSRICSFFFQPTLHPVHDKVAVRKALHASDKRSALKWQPMTKNCPLSPSRPPLEVSVGRSGRRKVLQWKSRGLFAIFQDFLYRG